MEFTQGWELIFMAPRSRRHAGEPVLDAVVGLAAAQGLTHYTRRTDTEGAGAGGRVHSAHFFDLADEPEELTFVATEPQAAALLAAVERAGLQVFALRRLVEYVQLGGASGG